MSAPSVYTPDHDSLILSLSAQGHTDAQIGQRLGKSAAAIRHRRQRLPRTQAERLVAGHRRKVITVGEVLVLAARLRLLRRG